MLKFLLILSSLIAIKCESTTEINLYPEEVEKCLVEGVSFEPGIYKRPFTDKCMYMYCTPDGVSTIANCPKYTAPPKDCEHGEYLDPNGDYPKCCRRKIVCKDDE